MPSTDFSIVIKAEDEASAKFQNLGKTIKDTQPSFRALAAGSAAVAGGMALIAGKAIQMASQFQAGMANVSTLVNTAEVDMDKLGKAVLDMSKTIPKSAADLTKGLYQVVSAGISAADATEYLGIAAKAATAGLATTEEAVNTITTVIKGYGMEAGDAMTVSDQLFQVVKLGQTTFSELAAAIGRVVPLAAALDVQLAETNALFATLTGVTGNTNEVSTQTAAIMRAMIKPTEDMSKAIKEVGKEFGITTAKGLIGKFGLVNGLEKLIGTTNGTQESVAKLFGRAEALTAVFALTGSQSDIFKQKLEAMGNAAGSTEKAFRKQMETFTAQWTIFKNVMTAIFIKIGDQLLPVVTKLVQTLKNLADKFSNLSDTQAKYLVIIGSVVGAAAGLIAAFSGIVLILPSIIAGIKALGMTLTLLVTNPIGIAIIAIAALTAGIYLWYSATQDKISQIDKELSQIDTLAKRYNELIENTKRTKEETIELKKISEELNILMPGLIKNTDGFGKAQKISADQVKEHTEKLLAQKKELESTGRGIRAVSGIFVGMGKIIIAAVDSIITNIVNMTTITLRSLLALINGFKSIGSAIINFRRILSGELKLGDIFANTIESFKDIGEGVEKMRADTKAGFVKMVDEAADANKKWRDTWTGKPAKAEIEVETDKKLLSIVTPSPSIVTPPPDGGGLTDEKIARQEKLQEEIIKMNAETRAILLAAERDSYDKRIAIINNETDERIKALEKRKTEEPALAAAIDAQIIAIETEREAKLLTEKQKLADQTLAIQEKTEDIRIGLIENSYDREKAILDDNYQDKVDKINAELDAIKIGSDKEIALRTALLAQIKALQEEHVSKMNELDEQQAQDLVTKLEFKRVLQEAYNEGDIEAYQELLKTKVAIDEEFLTTSQQVMDRLRETSMNFYADIVDFALTASEAITSGLSDTLSSIILKTKDAKTAWEDFGKALLKVLVDYTVKWIVTHTIGRALALVTAAIQSAAGAAVAAAWAPAAAMVSLASFGANAGPATAGIASTVGIAKGLASYETAPGEWKLIPHDMPAMVHKDEWIGTPKRAEMTSRPTTIIENHYNISPQFSGIFPNDPEFFKELTLTHIVPQIREANQNVSGSVLD